MYYPRWRFQKKGIHYIISWNAETNQARVKTFHITITASEISSAVRAFGH